MTETAEVEMDGGGAEAGRSKSGSGLVTKWLSVRALEAEGSTAEKVDVEGSGGTLTLVASTGGEDRAGDLIKPTGWELDAYRENPVFLWAHDYRRPAIGRSVRTWVQEGLDGGRLMATIEFAPTPFAQEIRSLYAAGFMRGVSVGFRAIEMEPRTGTTGRRGVLFMRQELLEISAAPVPVNAGALIREGIHGRPGDPVVSGNSSDQEACATSLAAMRELREAPEIRNARHEIREFWRVLAGLTGEEAKSSDADRVGVN
ncbi:MAG: HK97 family phage prohead protease [Dehalococcoidia bacterium]|nr:HK97 family phage prohead protease [Dehalococcoidia bacterium]